MKSRPKQKDDRFLPYRVYRIDVEEHPAKTTNPIALVATSSLQSIEIALELNNSPKTPLLIIVVNTPQATHFWYAMHVAFCEDKDQKECMTVLNEFLIANKKTMFKGNHVELITNHYIKHMIKLYGFKAVKDIISNAQFIQGTWTSPSLVTEIRNKLLDKGSIEDIFVFPANKLVRLKNDNLKSQMLENIHALSPRLSIHVNTKKSASSVGSVHYIEDQTPETVRQVVDPIPLPSPASVPLPSAAPSGLFMPVTKDALVQRFMAISSRMVVPQTAVTPHFFSAPAAAAAGSIDSFSPAKPGQYF